GADSSLDIARTHSCFHFDLYLAESGKVAAGRGAEFVVGGKPEFLATFRVDAHDMGGVGRHPDHSKFTHRYLLIASLAIPPTFWNSSALLGFVWQDTRHRNVPRGRHLRLICSIPLCIKSFPGDRDVKAAGPPRNPRDGPEFAGDLGSAEFFDLPVDAAGELSHVLRIDGREH